MLLIIISRTEPYYEGAMLIHEACVSIGIGCDIRYVEDVLSEADITNHAANGCVVYFLTNASSVPNCISRITQTAMATVVNRNFLVSDTTKYSMQSRLRAAGVRVPASVPIPTEKSLDTVLEKLRLPVYIKSQKQASTVVRAEIVEEFYSRMSGSDSADFYVEESVDLEKFHLEKLYYVDGYIDSKNDNLTTERNLETVLKHISRLLELDVFSADIFVGRGGHSYFCIDVNPAPALFHSGKARAHLAVFAQHSAAMIERHTNKTLMPLAL